MLDLGAQALDVHVDQAGVGRVAITPHLLEQHLAGEDLPWPTSQADQEIELKRLLSAVRTEDEGLFVLQHKYWHDTMLKALEQEQRLIPVEAVQ